MAERLGIGPTELHGRASRAGLRPHDGLGPGGSAGRTRPATTSTTWRWPVRWPTSVGPANRRRRPLNLLADFGGGGLLLALGVCAALVERATSGRGQVIDAAMVDGVALLSCAIGQAYTGGYFSTERGTNLFDAGAPFYDCYETADGQWLSVGAARGRSSTPTCSSGSGWPTASAWPGGPGPRPRRRGHLAGAAGPLHRGHRRSRTLDAWLEAFADLDACVAPVRPLHRGGRRSARRRPRHLGRRTTAWSNRRRRRASTAPRPPSTAPRRPPATTPTRCWPTPASPPTEIDQLRAAGAVA